MALTFLTSIYSQTQANLNSINIIYLDDINIKIVDDGQIVGFVCESLTPVRFVGVLDFGVHSDAFEAYLTIKGYSTLEFIYDDDITTIPIEEEVISSGDSIKPYISTTGIIMLFHNENRVVKLAGGNFDPDMTMDFGTGITFNGFDEITDKELSANITAGSANQASKGVKLFRGSNIHFGETPRYGVANNTTGTGPAGTYNWGMAGGNGLGAFDGNWQLEIFGGVNSIDGFFRTSNTSTPSGTTGPDGSDDGFYLFSEKTSPNNGTGNYGQISTSYFNSLTTVSFSYHMAGTDIGRLVLQSLDESDVWTERWQRQGNQQTQASHFLLSGNIDASGWSAKKIRFVFEDGGGYSGDIALDTIKIVSV